MSSVDMIIEKACSTSYIYGNGNICAIFQYLRDIRSRMCITWFSPFEWQRLYKNMTIESKYLSYLTAVVIFTTFAIICAMFAADSKTSEIRQCSGGHSSCAESWNLCSITNFWINIDDVVWELYMSGKVRKRIKVSYTPTYTRTHTAIETDADYRKSAQLI